MLFRSARAAAVIRETVARRRAAVAFSGGRDSVALAMIAEQVAPGLPLMHVDTGHAWPGLLDFVRQFAGPRLRLLSAGLDPHTLWTEARCYPVGAKVAARVYRRDNSDLAVDGSKCCQRLKADPVKRWIEAEGIEAVIFGARGDDTTRHAFKLRQGEAFEPKTGAYAVAYPLLTWTYKDTHAFLDRHFPDYPLRYSHNQEMGCQGCAVDLARWPNNLSYLRQSDPARYRHLIAETGLGLQILMIAYDLTRAGAEALVDRDGWDRLIEAGAFDRIPKARSGRR